MAIIIASRIKLNLQQLLRKKIVMCVAVRIKMAIIIASRIKLNLQQLLRKKNSHVCSSKDKNGFF